MHVRGEFRAKNAANVLLRNSCYWSQLPQLSYYKSENWFPSILTLPYSDSRRIFSNSQLIILPSPREPGQQGCQSCHFITETFYDNPLWNHHEHQYTGTPWGSSGDNRLSDISYEYHLADHKNCHISTFISQHGPLTADNVSPRTDKLSDSEKFTFYLRYFFPCSELHYSQGVRSVIVNILMWRVQISAMSLYIAELLQSIIIL